MKTTLHWLLSLSCLVSCVEVDRKTQVTVAFSSETEIPEELDNFTLRVLSRRTGELRFSQEYEPKNGSAFPTTLAIIPANNDSLQGPVEVQIEGRKGSAIAVSRRLVVSFVKERNILVRMPLRMACFQFRDCAANETCAGGTCVPAEVNTSALTDYTPEQVFSSSSTSCFDEEKCLGQSQEVTVAQDCTFTLPSAADGGNVSIRWAAAPARLLALEAEDDLEGWVRVSQDRGRLSKGACDSHFQRRDKDGKLLVSDWAQKVYFDAQCRSKTIAQPYCLSAITGHSGIGAVKP